MKVYALFVVESDGCTYSADILTGIYSDRDLAEIAILENIEKVAKYHEKMAEFDRKFRDLRDQFPNQMSIDGYKKEHLKLAEEQRNFIKENEDDTISFPWTKDAVELHLWSIREYEVQ